MVSTVGNLPDALTGKVMEIGYERYYETMTFAAKKDGAYWEADVSNQLDINGKWRIEECEAETDLEADEMHEAIVAEVIKEYA